MNTKKLAALTFDDGPNTTTTLQVLDILKKHGVTASFFVVGNNITPESEKSMRRAAEMDCEIENHSQTHSAMTEMDPDDISAEIKFTSDRIEAVVGRRPKFFRPPYIAYNQTMFDTIDLTFICGVGAEDYNDEVSADERCKRIMEQVSDGTVILLHDMEGNFRTVDALDMLIPKLKADGYELVTVSELFEKCGIIPERNVIYTNVYCK
ncbi:MAG: polysaccharide deacetylase family protein [Oscillospiraceae bacterium]